MAVLDEDVPAGVVYVHEGAFHTAGRSVRHWFHHHRPSVAGDALGTFPEADHNPGKHNRGLGRPALGGSIVGQCAGRGRRQGVRISTQHDGDDFRVTRPAPRLRGADVGAESGVATPRPVRSAPQSMVTVRCGDSPARPIRCSDVELNDRAWRASSASAVSRSAALTPAGIAFIVSVITRTCAGPICPAASAAEVSGSNAGRFSPVSAARGELGGVGDSGAGLGR